MLVNRVYDLPSSGLWAKLRIIIGPQRGTRHASQTTQFTAPIAQHMRFPSEALRMGWNNWTYDQVNIAFIVSGSGSIADFSEARVP